ncbi:kinase-like protein [Ceratobasidium sp. AG-I]|nr:kinase-like protein [Ceratobasidium sp. AG-I]
MSASETSLLPTPVITVKDITKLVRVNRISDHQYQEAGLEGSANIFWFVFGFQVPIKTTRANELDGQDPSYEQKMRKARLLSLFTPGADYIAGIQKLAWELEIWRNLGGGNNIIELLGIITGIGPLPSPVCELSAWNLKAMIDTLQGLSYMHELQHSPIARGDIKSHNILATEDEKGIICDPGRSRSRHDQLQEDSRPSPFGATLRYMSPELFVCSGAGPTPASDMWACGCVALEILYRVQPYHEVANDCEAIELIRQGRVSNVYGRSRVKELR